MVKIKGEPIQENQGDIFSLRCEITHRENNRDPDKFEGNILEECNKTTGN